MKYEIGSFSVDGECVGGCEDEGETVDIGNTFGKPLLWLERLPVAVTFITTCLLKLWEWWDNSIFSLQAHKHMKWALYGASNPLWSAWTDCLDKKY